MLIIDHIMIPRTQEVFNKISWKYKCITHSPLLEFGLYWGWNWKWLLKVWSKLWFHLLRFPAKPFKPVYTYRHIKAFTHLPDNQNLNLFAFWMGKRKKKKSGYWVYQCLANNTNRWNTVLSLLKIFSQSQGLRREREFCPLNLEGRDNNEIFLLISHGSRRDRDIFFQVSCFEMGLRDKINLIPTRIFEIEKSRHALSHGRHDWPWSKNLSHAGPQTTF